MRQVPLFSVVFLDQLSLSIIFPILAFIFFDKDSSLFVHNISQTDRSLWYGVCMALMCLSSFIVAPLLSTYSDSFGRKRALLFASVSAFIFALLLVVGIWTGILALLLAGSFLGGRATNANPIAQAIVGDQVSSTNKIIRMGYLQFSGALGAFLGPILGGYLGKSYFFNTLNFSLPGVAALIFSSISLGIVCWVFKETHANKKSSEFTFFQFRVFFSNKSIVNLILILVLFQMSWSTFYQFIPVVLKTIFHFSATQLGLFVGLIALWLCVATTLGLKIINKFFAPKQIITFSAVTMLLGFSALIFAVHYQTTWLAKILLWLAGAFIPMGDVMAYCALTTLFSNATSVTEQGKVMGLCSMLTALVWTITALGGGMLAAINVKLPLMIAPIGIVGFFIYRQIYQRGLYYDAVSRCW